MKYVLYSGAGNTFALTYHPLSSVEAIQLCQETGVDGVIFSNPLFQMHIFNRDGSLAEMCGNGLRCFIKFLIEQGIHQERYTIQTLAGSHSAWTEGEDIGVSFPPPRDLRWNLSVGPHTLHHLNTGVPHAILFVDSVDAVDLNQLGPFIRYHPLFPEGANVNVVDPHTLHIRTFERGVEKETLACGTGAVASALAAAKIFGYPSPLCIHVRSGEQLKISFTSDWDEVTLTGPARRLAEGVKNVQS